MARLCSFTTQGCHFDCEFCSVSPFNGKTTLKGTLPPLAKVLKNLQAKLPTVEPQQIIPNALHPQPSPGSNPQEFCLKVKARRHDGFAALVIDLKGTLDHLNAKELVERIKQAGWDAKMAIAVNVENLKQATPKAICTLLDGEMLRAITPHTKLRYRNLKKAFQFIVSEISLEDMDLLDEDIQYA